MTTNSELSLSVRLVQGMTLLQIIENIKYLGVRSIEINCNYKLDSSLVFLCEKELIHFYRSVELDYLDFDECFVNVSWNKDFTGSAIMSKRLLWKTRRTLQFPVIRKAKNVILSNVCTKSRLKNEDFKNIKDLISKLLNKKVNIIFELFSNSKNVVYNFYDFERLISFVRNTDNVGFIINLNGFLFSGYESNSKKVEFLISSILKYKEYFCGFKVYFDNYYDKKYQIIANKEESLDLIETTKDIIKRLSPLNEVNPKTDTLQKSPKDRNQLRFLFFSLVEL